MPGKRAENVLEIKAYIKGRLQLGLKATDMVCNIYLPCPLRLFPVQNLNTIYLEKMSF